MLLFNGKNIGESLDEHRGWTHGFDYLRITLAASVIGWHTVGSSYGPGVEGPLYASWLRPFIMLILPMFFAMGGFLVTGSLSRCHSVKEYLLLRVLRFLPGLVGVIGFASLIEGPLVSANSPEHYFNQPEFFSYWLTALGYVHFYLPGVFLSNPAGPFVNISLWTIPWEFWSCVGLCGLIIYRDVLRQRHVLAIAAALLTFIPFVAIATHNEVTLFARPPGHLLVMCLIPGVLLYLFRYQVPVNRRLFIAALLISLALFSKAKTAYFAPPFIAYVTIYLGLLHPPKYWIMKNADFSYGLYLYGFLVQQTYVYLFPDYRIWWLNWIFSLLFATICAVPSWYLIEAPFLKRKKQLSRLLDIWTIRLARLVRRNDRRAI